MGLFAPQPFFRSFCCQFQGTGKWYSKKPPQQHSQLLNSGPTPFFGVCPGCGFRDESNPHNFFRHLYMVGNRVYLHAKPSLATTGILGPGRWVFVLSASKKVSQDELRTSVYPINVKKQVFFKDSLRFAILSDRNSMTWLACYHVCIHIL